MILGLLVLFCIFTSSFFIWYFFIYPKKQDVGSIYTYPSKSSRPGSLIYRNGQHWQSGDDFIESVTEDGNEIHTLYELYEFAAEKFKDFPFIGTRPILNVIKEKKSIRGEEREFTYYELGEYQWKTYGEAKKVIYDFASGLRHIGLQPENYLGMCMDTREEWTIAERAAYTQSIVMYTIYSNLGSDALTYALNEGEVEYIMIEKSSFKTIAKVKKNVQSLKYVIYTGDASKHEIEIAESSNLKVYSYNEILELGRTHSFDPVPPSPDSIACIMYTSGSTGYPKGVVTTHKNILTATNGVTDTMKIDTNDTYLHYLPLAHSFANMIENAGIRGGIRFAYGTPRTLSSEGVRNCNGDLKESRPTLFVAVPAIYNKVKHGITDKVKKKGKIITKLFNFAISEKLRAMKGGNKGSLWDLLFFNRIRKEIGVDRLRLMVSGSAPLSGEMHDFMRAVFGAPLLQGYGLTETVSCGCVQNPTDWTNSSVGLPFSNVEIRLIDVEDTNYTHDQKYPAGEIWLRGPSITNGYFKNKEKTEESFIKESDSRYCWFATGDIGKFQDGTFRIVDRKKHLVKMSHGEYIAIEKLESVYKNCPLLDSVCVHADSSKRYCIMIASPNIQRFKEQFSIDNISKAINDEDIINKLLSEVQKEGKNSGLSSIEIVRGLILDEEEWTPKNNKLTAAMKINRKIIFEEFKDEIERVYENIE